jgi:tetratricopeptide (TPR) repeat protein
MTATSRGVLALLMLLSSLAWSGPASAQDEDQGLARARAAAASGDSSVAIVEYDRLLANAPDDVVLLNESAQQLSWQGRYTEAIARYDRVLALSPGNRFALLERAKVLSWAKRYAESVRAFEALMRLEPADLEARLGLARVRSWSGDQPGARSDYQSILGDHPGDREALLGLAQTYAWSGDLGEARSRYQDLRGNAEYDKDADLGTAYLDLWEGNLGGASRTAARLKAWYPGDRDVDALWRATRSAAAPSLAVNWDQMDDTDRNLLTTTRYEAAARLPNGVGLRLAYADYDVQTAGEDGSIGSLQLSAEFSPRARHQVEVMGGVDRLERPQQPSHFVTDWGLTYRFPLADDWNGFVSARREPYRYSVPLIDNRIVVDSYAVGASGKLGDHWHSAVEGSAWNVSDGNDRLAATASTGYRWTASGHTLDLGGAFRWLDWRKDLDSGYFDPSNFTSLGATFRAFGPVPAATHLDYDLSLEAGLQSFDFAGNRTSGDPYYLTVARLGWQVSGAARLEVFGESGSYASEGAQEWRYTRAGIRLLWRFGMGAH